MPQSFITNITLLYLSPIDRLAISVEDMSENTASSYRVGLITSDLPQSSLDTAPYHTAPI